MRLLFAIVLAGFLGFTAPVFAQTPGSDATAQNNATVQNDVNGQPPANTSSDAVTAYDQAPPPTNLTPFVIGGLAVGGLTAIIVVATQNKNNNNTTTPAPASP